MTSKRPQPADAVTMLRRRSTDRVDLNDVLGGGGEMGALMRSMDWSKTALGPVETWPQSLRTAISILLNSRYPMFVFWGDALVKIYNDSYRPITGAKHPWALGRPGPEVWPEIWDTIGPMVDRVIDSGEATWSTDLMLFMERSGFPEEVYFTFSYSPIRIESGGIGGMFCACTETTEKVLGERRLRTLRDLAAGPTEARSIAEVCRVSCEVLGRNVADVPFSLLYLLGDEGNDARLVATSGTTGDEIISPPFVRIEDEGGWPLATVARTLRPELSSDLAARFPRVPRGPWPEPPTSAMVWPLVAQGYERAVGLLVLGIGSRRTFDESYESFFSLVSNQIATSIAKAGALEEQRRRAEALAEVDRAKTAFFSNVSHEFRTPLTLMLGPTEDLLSGAHGILTPEQRVQIELLRRSELRLQRLVNALLEFSRIEAGRMQASYEPVDLAVLTRDVASSFRAAMERAGLSFTVNCSPPNEPVFVDREMWEEILLNLLSNAFKFTFEGEIKVSLRPEDDHVILQVADTGVGVPPEEMPRLFERFHRVEGTRARTHEGSGIGLALVQELVRLHGGTIRADSTYGVGTSFTVTIPRGSAHLPHDRIGASRTSPRSDMGPATFVEEALRWLPSETSVEDEIDRKATVPVNGRILVVDDNADMRDYLRRTLEAQWSVGTATDGESALAAARVRRPDLILTDIMMPGLDGFGLLQHLRADPALATVPVIMLSARAGEEARVEGLQAGAEDYLIKPFSARELLARVRTHLELARLRNEIRAQREHLYSLFMQAPVPICVLRGQDLIFEMANPLYHEVAGHRDLLGKPFLEGIPEARGQGFDELLRNVMRTGKAYVGKEMLVQLDRDHDGVPEDTYFNFIYAPIFNDMGDADRAIAVVNDVTEQVLARRAIEASEEKFRRIVGQVEAGIAQIGLSGYFTLVNERFCELVGRSETELRQLRVPDITHPDDMQASVIALRKIVDDGVPFVIDKRLVRPDGSIVWVQNSVSRIDDHEGRAHGVAAVVIDISQRRYAEQAVKAAEQEREARLAEMEQAVRFSEMFVGILGHDLRNPLSAITTAANLLEVRADSERIAKPVGRILVSADRMERMISQLLDFTRIRLGRGLPLERASADLVEVARVVISELELVYKREIRLEASGDVTGTWDRDRLHQLLSNLAGNACQYGTPGAPVCIELDGSDADVIRLTVRNEGAVPAHLLPVLFEPLGSTDRRVKRDRPSGLGLGLYISQQIAIAHGGTITVASSEQEGTLFSVEIARSPSGETESVFSSAGASQ